MHVVPTDPPYRQTLHTDRPSIPADPPYRQTLHTDRPSIPTDPPYRQTLHTDRPSIPADPPYRQTLHTDRPSIPTDNPYRQTLHTDRPSIPADPPYRQTLPTDRPSIPTDPPYRQTLHTDRPSIPADPPYRHTLQKTSAPFSCRDLKVNISATDRSSVAAPVFHYVKGTVIINYYTQSQRGKKTDGLSVSTPSTPTSLSINTSASDQSHVVTPAFSSSNIGRVTINTSIVNITPHRREKNNKAQTRTMVGEISGALVTAEYHCSGCGLKIPSWNPPRFRVRCSGCKTSWRCDKVPCTCKAKIVLEQERGQIQRVTLDDLLLRSIVRFKLKGYCKTKSIEMKILKVGTVRVMYDAGVVSSVTKFTDSL
ncbi:hypothetical protein C0J45_14721 [Silurus meridionalis]|nr:hypothetical protein C0J45_14721 [Silurus meridionalis]